MKKSNIFNFSLLKPFRVFAVASFILFCFGCKGEISLYEMGLKKEKEGEQEEAIFYYKLSLEKNTKYFPANKHLGLILAESLDSTILAIKHLEIARTAKPEDKEVIFKLFDLFAIHKKVDKYKRLLNESKKTLSDAELLYLSKLSDCLFKERVKKEDNSFWMSEENFIYTSLRRSTILCLKKKEIEIPESLIR
jgi:tetratricopeptide (TPR) repeat protein